MNCGRSRWGASSYGHVNDFGVSGALRVIPRIHGEYRSSILPAYQANDLERIFTCDRQPVQKTALRVY